MLTGNVMLTQSNKDAGAKASDNQDIESHKYDDYLRGAGRTTTDDHETSTLRAKTPMIEAVAVRKIAHVQNAY